MQSTSLISAANRVFFAVAFLLLAAAVSERVANAFGYTLMEKQYTPGRLLEFAAIALLFVIALLLRSIRDELRRGAT